MDLATLRSMRKNSSNKILAEMDKISNPKENYVDDRFWKLEGDKVGNGSAIIRFLPGPDPTALPWVRLFTHAFKGPTGRWYFEKSLTTIGQQDPVSDLNTALWNSGIEADKAIARKQKRQLGYIANILVISDSKHPEYEGKVMLFKFGKKIFDKIMAKAKPVFDDEPVIVFDPFAGANFKLRMRRVEDYANFDESLFLDSTPISEDENEMLDILNRQHPLTEFDDPKTFKTYDELKKKLDEVLKPGVATSDNAEMSTQSPANTNTTVSTKQVEVNTAPWDDDDDAMAFFKKIAQDD